MGTSDPGVLSLSACRALWICDVRWKFGTVRFYKSIHNQWCEICKFFYVTYENIIYL
jgi:hypothetical protein